MGVFRRCAGDASGSAGTQLSATQWARRSAWAARPWIDTLSRRTFLATALHRPPSRSAGGPLASPSCPRGAPARAQRRVWSSSARLERSAESGFAQAVVVRTSATAQAVTLVGCSLLREKNVRPSQRTASGPLIGAAAEFLGKPGKVPQKGDGPVACGESVKRTGAGRRIVARRATRTAAAGSARQGGAARASRANPPPPCRSRRVSLPG